MEEEYSDVDGTLKTQDGVQIPKFRPPKRLRGWMFLERSKIPTKEIPAILNQTKNTHINKLQTILVESYSDHTVRDIDSRQNAPRNPHKVNYADDDDYNCGYEEASTVEDVDWEQYGWTWDEHHQAYYNDDGWYDEEEYFENDYLLDDSKHVTQYLPLVFEHGDNHIVVR